MKRQQTAIVDPVKNIDFLPPRYRQQRAKKKAQYVRVGVLGVYAAIIVVVISMQRMEMRRLNKELQSVQQQHQIVTTKETQLAAIEQRLKDAESQAALLTYQRHRWATSKVLEAILTPLPESIHLQELAWRHDVPATPKMAAPPAEQGRERSKKKQEEAPQNLPPAVMDLEQMRQRHDPLQLTVMLSGVTDQPHEVHMYLQALDQLLRVQRAELLSLDSVSPGEGPSEIAAFDIRIVFTPEPGKPGAVYPERPTEQTKPAEVAETLAEEIRQ